MIHAASGRQEALNHGCKVTGKHEIVRSHFNIALAILGGN
jgi:hypothetical protein